MVYLCSSFFSSSYFDKDASVSKNNVRLSAGNPLQIGGLSPATEDPFLFGISVFFVLGSFITWLKLAWLDNDPGRIDTRDRDFEEVFIIYTFPS